MKFDNELLQVLCPFGQWQHPKGMQIVDEESARRMKRAAGWSAISQIPVYIGHPDDIPSRKKPKAVGKVKQICKTLDGIAVVIAYSKECYQNIINGKYTAMSPRWQMEHIQGEQYRPVKLISVGLTNNPNIPESGKILSMKDDSNQLLQATIGKTKSISKRVEKLGMQLCKISDKAEKLRQTLASERISRRVQDRKNTTQKQVLSERKMSASKLVEAAQTRSRIFGEPYTKSFAFVKKQKI